MTIATFFQNIETQAATWAKNEYANVIKPLMEKEAAAFKPLLQATEQDMIEYGVPIILSFFGTAGAALSGSAKMGGAVSSLISALGSAGKTIAVADAQAGLQIVVNQIKAAAANASTQLAAK